MSTKTKALSPIIVAILLLVVGVILVTIILSWGKDFTTKSLNDATGFTEADSSQEMVSFQKLQNMVLMFKNISPGNKDITIVGYKINSSFNHELLNKINYLPGSVALSVGQTGIIKIVDPPENSFDVELYTSDRKYITIRKIKDSRPTETFTAQLGNSGQVDNIGRDGIQTSDGGYLILEDTLDGLPAISIIKLDYLGNHDWNKTFSSLNMAVPTQVLETSDGGYLILGNADTINDWDMDIWLIKTNSSGEVDWNSTFAGENWETPIQVLETDDGGYLVLGCTDDIFSGLNRDIWLIKTNSSGEVDWNYTFGGDNVDIPTQVLKTSDDGYLILGNTDSYGSGNGDIWLLKTNSSGELDWNYTFGDENADMPTQVLETSDGGYLILGDTYSYSADGGNIWLIKTDTEGNVDWNKTFGPGLGEYSIQVLETSDGGYLVLGNPDGLSLFKINSSGNQDWNKVFDAGYNGYNSILETPDGGYLIIAENGGIFDTYYDVSNAHIIKIDSSGNTIKETTIGGRFKDHIYSTRKTTDGGAILVGETTSFGGTNIYEYPILQLCYPQTFVIKINSEGYASTSNLPLSTFIGEEFMCI